MNIRRFFGSICDAMRGIRHVFLHEQNFRIQVVVAIVVTVAIFFFHVHFFESIVLFLLILSVLILELVNSAVEKSFDILKPRLSNHVQVAKDMMAGTVLIASLGAFAIAMAIFYPYIVAGLGKL